MQELKVYIVNLGKYNEGEEAGAWFTLPVDPDEVAERIGLNGNYEEYAIHDYELPVDIDRYMSLEELNRLPELVEKVAERIGEDNIQAVLKEWFSSLEELADHVEDIIWYSYCSSMEELAYLLINDEGLLDSVPDSIRRYFDYESYGRDMEIEGQYLITSNGIFEYLC